MEALQTYASRGYHDPLGEPPPEIMAEIKEGLDSLYPSQQTELGEEVQLTREQARIAILRQLTLSIAEGDSYRGINTASEDKRGVVAPISFELGMGHDTVRDAIKGFAKDGLLDIEPAIKVGPKVIRDVFITLATTAAMSEVIYSKSDDFSAAEDYLIRRKRETILLVCKEINHEEELLGIEELSSFKDISSLDSLEALSDYLQFLQELQNRRLSALGGGFH